MRMLKWAVPVVVFGLIVAGMQLRATAEEKATGTVSGTVVDKDGKAVGSAKVKVMAPKSVAEPKADKAAGGAKPTPVAQGETDSEGKFSITGVPAGKYNVVANAKGVGQAKQEVEVKAGETATVDLKLAQKAAK